MQEEHILIDKLEDELIDNPDVSTRKELNLSLDETFQRKLNARAEQIANLSDKEEYKDGNKLGFGAASNYQFLITRSKLNYHHRDIEPLNVAIRDWFTAGDIEFIGLERIASAYQDDKDLRGCISRLEQLRLTTKLDCLLYYTLGEYEDLDNEDSQLLRITDNVRHLLQLGLVPVVVAKVKELIQERVDNNYFSTAEQWSIKMKRSYFLLLTILYVMVNVTLHSKEVHLVRDSIREHDLLSSLVLFLEKWKWSPNKEARARNLIQLVSKLIYVDFGDQSDLKACSAFLNKIHGTKKNNESSLLCSPLDYFTFREDLMDKYPLSSFVTDPDNEKTRENIDRNHDYFMAVNNQSNTVPLSTAKSNRTHSVFGQLPAQTVHIATPVPSPALISADYMAGGEKVRKSYQVNQSLPFIYPTDRDFEVPASIQEAEQIFRDAVYESYSSKQLWKERQLFMAQERGNGYGDKARDIEFDDELLKAYPNNRSEIESISRVESFYQKTLPYLKSFTKLLLDSIENFDFGFQLNFAELKLNSDSTFDASISPENDRMMNSVLLRQVELFKLRQIMIKNCSDIVVLLLRWFKRSHALKYNYLASIIYDLNYFKVLLEFLSQCFNNTNLQQVKPQNENTKEYEYIINQNMLMNPEIQLPEFDFFSVCLKKVSNNSYKFINKTFILKLPVVIESDLTNKIVINNFNESFCHSLTNLLTIANKVLNKDIVERIITLNDQKPSELMKMFLINYDNEHLSQPLLKILKKLIPYQGRKWKSMNMDLISLIYLNLKLSLKDDWLSGKDLESDFNNSKNQEIALRSLLQFYNLRKYSDLNTIPPLSI